jgi:predicted secreted protein
MASNYIRGDELMLFYNGNAFAWATSHTLNLTSNTIDVATKDHGYWGASEVGKLNWTISTENLYSDDDFATLFNLWTAKTPITVAFAKAGNYDPNGLQSVGGDVQAWTPDSTVFFSGQAVISNISVNANTGENATYSAEFTGVGPFTQAD